MSHNKRMLCWGLEWNLANGTTLMEDTISLSLCRIQEMGDALTVESRSGSRAFENSSVEQKLWV